MLWRNVQKAGRVWAEQPFIAGGDSKIRADHLSIKGQCPQTLGEVDYEGAVNLIERPAHDRKINQRAVGPMAMGQGSNGRLAVNRIDNGSSPVIVCRTGHRMQVRAALSGEFLPDVKVRRILFRQHENVLPRFNDQIFCRNSESITG